MASNDNIASVFKKPPETLKMSILFALFVFGVYHVLTTHGDWYMSKDVTVINGGIGDNDKVARKYIHYLFRAT